MRIIQTLLQSPVFLDRPPVLVDIGASGEINPKWKQIAPFSICIAFDADDREFKISEETGKGFKKLITINRIVTAEQVQQTDFYLTSSPFCSSLLEPDTENLQSWLFSPLFAVDKKTALPAITLPVALGEKKLEYIDWFKTDTQGTDLRLFKSLPDNLRSHVLAAEFEPGIIDAYRGEDKLFSVMEFMQSQQFWLSSMVVRGTYRLRTKYKDQVPDPQRTLRRSPGWAEVTYLRHKLPTEKRQLLLLYIFSLLEKQYGFALEIADHALNTTQDKVFEECKKAVLSKLQAEKWKKPLVIFKRQVNKLFSGIND